MIVLRVFDYCLSGIILEMKYIFLLFQINNLIAVLQKKGTHTDRHTDKKKNKNKTNNNTQMQNKQKLREKKDLYS